MRDWDRFPRPDPKLPLPKRGIKLKQIGSTWWGQRWIAALVVISRTYQSRLERGRTYARAGRVHDLEILPGRVRARVTGAQPYEVTIELAVLAPRAWERAIRAMSKQALFAAELLSGRMPEEIDSAFKAARSSLFPVHERDLRTECSCPDWANPCKHVAAVHYILGEAFDRDPFLLFELRGRKKDDVLSALRERRTKKSDRAASVPAPVEAGIPSLAVATQIPADYERLRAALPALHLRLEPPLSQAALLRSLGNPPSWSIPSTPADLLGPAIQSAAALARELALRTGDPPAPVAPDERLPRRRKGR